MRRPKDRDVPDIRFNPYFKEEGRTCGYEHCIETMPFSGSGLDCPIFGHDCPGGEAQLAQCRSVKSSPQPAVTPLALDAPETPPGVAKPIYRIPVSDRTKLRAALEALRAVEPRVPLGPERETVQGVCTIIEEILQRGENR